MRFYLDTLVMVAALTHEPATMRVLTWIDDQGADSLALSEWVRTEFSSALSIKLRTGQIEATDRAIAAARFAQMIAESLTMLPISVLHFRSAARFADQHALGLRAGDALHLAVCADHGVTLCTLDRRLGKSGLAAGVRTVLL